MVTSTGLCCLQLLSYAPPSSSNIYRNWGHKLIAPRHAPPSSSNIYRNWGHKLIDSMQGGRGRCLQGSLWHSPPASMTSRLTSVTFKMASKVFIEETDFRFLGLKYFFGMKWPWWTCRSREIDRDPATRPAKQINKTIQSRTQNISMVYRSRL